MDAAKVGDRAAAWQCAGYTETERIWESAYPGSFDRWNTDLKKSNYELVAEYDLDHSVLYRFAPTSKEVKQVFCTVSIPKIKETKQDFVTSNQAS